MTGPEREFIVAACVPRDASHASGTLEHAREILAAHPAVASASIHTAAIVGDDNAVRAFLDRDPAGATVPGGPYGWDALTHLCFSRYLRLEPSRSEGFVRAATALLNAGASANTGWTEEAHEPRGTRESVLYGAAGVAHHAQLTALLLSRGADPNDDEVAYHAPEGYDNAALSLLLATGRVTTDNLALMLLRKLDWHDVDGVKLLLEHGADAGTTWRGITPLRQAVRRDNALAAIELLLDRGADPAQAGDGPSAVELAASRGRADVLAAFERRGFSLHLQGVAALVSACARDDAGAVERLAADPALVLELLARGGRLLGAFAGAGNGAGIGRLLQLGVPIDARDPEGDGYFGVAGDSTALHVAAWRAQHDVVHLLIERGADVNALDAEGRTPLMLAVKACVDSYWMSSRSPRSVRALLAAGARKDGVSLPTGYAAIDELLAE